MSTRPLRAMLAIAALAAQLAMPLSVLCAEADGTMRVELNLAQCCGEGERAPEAAPDAMPDATTASQSSGEPACVCMQDVPFGDRGNRPDARARPALPTASNAAPPAWVATMPPPVRCLAASRRATRPSGALHLAFTATVVLRA